MNHKKDFIPVCSVCISKYNTLDLDSTLLFCGFCHIFSDFRTFKPNLKTYIQGWQFVENFSLVLIGLFLGYFLNLAAIKISKLAKKSHRSIRFHQIVLAGSILLTPCCLIMHYSRFHSLGNMELLIGQIYIAVLICVSICDLLFMIIPNFVLLTGGLLLLILRILNGTDQLSMNLYGGLAGFVIFAILFLISRGGIGAGDVKLMALIGLFTGWPKVIAAMLTITVTGAILAAVLLMINKQRNASIPYGPGMALGAYIVYMWF